MIVVPASVACVTHLSVLLWLHASCWTRLQDSPAPAAAAQSVVSLPVDGASDVSGQGLAFVELATERDSYFVYEPIELRVRFGLESGLLANNLVQLFRRELDLPVQLQASGLGALDGVVTLDDDQRERAQATRLPQLAFALDETVVAGTRVDDRVDGERRFAVLEIVRRYLPTQAGELTFPAPVLRFAYATRFEDDFVNGRVAADRRDVFVRGAPLALHIRALPDEGRPVEFGGAVGDFTLQAEVDARSLRVGESLELLVEIGGTGNFEFFETPRLDRLEGWQLRGAIDGKRATGRSVRYHLAPEHERVRELPALRFAFFDPRPPAGYRTLATQPIEIEVRREAEPVPAAPTSNDGGRRARFAAVLVSAVLAVIALAITRMVRRRARAGLRDPERARVRGAAQAFRAHVDADGESVADALTRFLAEYLRCATTAVLSRDLARRLESAGAARDVAERAARLLEALSAARYGGEAPADALGAARAVVDELDSAR